MVPYEWCISLLLLRNCGYLVVTLKHVAVVNGAPDLTNLESEVTLEETVDVVHYLCKSVQRMSLQNLYGVKGSM